MFLEQRHLAVMCQQIQHCTGTRIRQGFVMVERNIIAVATVFKVGRFVAFRTVNLAGTFPTVGDFEFIVIQSVMFHGMQEDFAVEGFVVRDQLAPKKPFADFRKMAIEILLIFGMRRINAVHPDVVVRIMIVRRLDECIILVGDDALVDRHDTNRAGALGMVCGRFEINRCEIHVGKNTKGIPVVCYLYQKP